MARLRRTSQVLETARQRLAGLKSITPPPTFGPTVTLNSYDASTAAFAQKLDTYNGTVATLDDLQNDLEADEEHFARAEQANTLSSRSAIRPRQQRVRIVRRHTHQRTEEIAQRIGYNSAGQTVVGFSVAADAGQRGTRIVHSGRL